MSLTRKAPGSHEPATVLQFPDHRTRAARHGGERFVSETYWMIVGTTADGATRLTKMRSPRFLSPCRAYSWSEGATAGVRSLLLYKFARRPTKPASRSAPQQSRTA